MQFIYLVWYCSVLCMDRYMELLCAKGWLATLFFIQAFRNMKLTKFIRTRLLTFIDKKSLKREFRIMCFLQLIRDITKTELRKLINMMRTESDQNVKTFMYTHLKNILDSKDPSHYEYEINILFLI